jgi:transcriptional regulator with XRE-family HTH domain
MKQSSKTVGRPTFRIDGTRLRALRIQVGLTQQALAQRVYASAKKWSSGKDVLKASAQRWERTGKIPRALVAVLAEELNTTIEVLQGALPEPAPSRVDDFEARIKRQIATGASPDLVIALDYYRDDDVPERELAIRLTGRLEAAQLSQAQDEFEAMETLTGYRVDELRQPMSHEGFWLLLGTGHLGPARSEILSGVTDVLYAVRTELQNCLEKFPESDGHISFTEEKNWFRVSLTHARLPQLTRTLRFVRCQPHESGLQWTSPTWQDRLRLEALPREAYEHANFVTGFDTVCVPAECTSLRLAIIKNPGTQKIENSSAEAKPEIVTLTEGNVAHLHSERLESWRREGNSHALVVSWLAANLWQELQPFMSEWPLECWRFSSAHTRIDVRLDVPNRLYSTSATPPNFGNRLSVSLVERRADGELKTAPWRKDSIARVCESLEKSRVEAVKTQAKATPQDPGV